MKKSNPLLVVLLLSMYWLSAQNTEGSTHTIQGIIAAQAGLFSEIEVINLNSEKSVKVNTDGTFQIEAKLNEELFFCSKNFKPYKKTITIDELSKQIICIELTPKGIELEEVIINQYPNINAKALGIIPNNQKSYSVAERKLKASGGGIDGVINLLSGRKEMLKKELEIETKEKNLAQLRLWFSNDFFYKSLNLTPDNLASFQYYCIENESFAKLITTKNKQEIVTALLQLADRYHNLNANVEKI